MLDRPQKKWYAFRSEKKGDAAMFGFDGYGMGFGGFQIFQLLFFIAFFGIFLVFLISAGKGIAQWGKITVRPA